MEVLTTETLAAAINYSPEYSHMGDDESNYLAEHILNFFGYSDRIIDNVLHPEDRDTFYMLEDAGLMETEREETTLYDGRMEDTLLASKKSGCNPKAKGCRS